MAIPPVTTALGLLPAGSRISAISAALKHVASAVLEMLRRQKRRRVGINAAAAVCLLPAAVFDCRNDAKILALHEPGSFFPSEVPEYFSLAA